MNPDTDGTRTRALQRDRLAFYATELRCHKNMSEDISGWTTSTFYPFSEEYSYSLQFCGGPGLTSGHKAILTPPGSQHSGDYSLSTSATETVGSLCTHPRDVDPSSFWGATPPGISQAGATIVVCI